VPIFTDIAGGTRHCIELVKKLENCLTLRKVREILAGVAFGNRSFQCEEAPGGFHIYLSGIEPDSYTGEPSMQIGRRWFVSVECTPSDVVRTAFKAVATWAEHEARETFKYRGVRVFGPHLDIDGKVARVAKCSE
jgi:hypothetical protein